MITWLAHQINHHPRATPGLVVARLCLWAFTFLWGAHALVQDNALNFAVYKSLGLQPYENAIGTVAMLFGAIQLWRIITHNGAHWFGFIANVAALLWHAYLISAMFVFVPLAGPVFSASMTLMCVIAIVSIWNDPWLNIKIFSLAT